MKIPQPAGSMMIKTKIGLMENFTSQHIIHGDDYLNIYGIVISSHEDRYLTIGENKGQEFSSSNFPKQISVLSEKKDTHKELFVSNQLSESQINRKLS
ncbi:hypothetical protein O181_024874 [Austropuccinia psidii MF-1]|uniref:Uncharacterized protein n=1 Tax=Austropuccinia psidii MF-1 TaxID=1389203 RepID=A0A9Q3CH02_9BASI|nr:hypothetical protein [Austropuccinia psidii MF-1]